MTLSGGECLDVQPGFATALLKGAHERGINTAIETAGNVSVALPRTNAAVHVDTVLHDLKLMDPRSATRNGPGLSNKRLLENFQAGLRNFSQDKTFIARRPLIPGGQ